MLSVTFTLTSYFQNSQAINIPENIELIKDNFSWLKYNNAHDHESR